MHLTIRRALALLVTASFSALALVGCGAPAGNSGNTLLVAEPAHNLSYLPLYVGIDQGLFANRGLKVSVTTLQGGAAHTNAVLSGQAWAFIGGPEHNGFVRSQGSGDGMAIKAIANIVNRGNVYFAARTGEQAPPATDVGALAAFLRGKKVVTSAYGGTPNSIVRYVLAKAGLVVNRDVTLLEETDASAPLATVAQGQADVAAVADPVLTQGIDQHIWQEPFFSVPAVLGPYAYSTINVRQDSITGAGAAHSRAFVAGLRDALNLLRTDHRLATAVATREFPNLDPKLITAALGRTYADNQWAYDAAITQPALDTALDVVRTAGILSDKADPATFNDLVDPRFLTPAPPA